jgi:pilus assembly protein Flp/PilA
MAIVTILKSLLRDTRAATAVEYGLIIAMIVLAMVASLQNVANEIILMWEDVETDVTTSTGS